MLCYCKHSHIFQNSKSALSFKKVGKSDLFFSHSKIFNIGNREVLRSACDHLLVPNLQLQI